MRDRWTVYCHTHIASGRHYVGLTRKTMMVRWNRHVYSAMHSKGGRWHFANAIRKYGKDAFEHKVLETCDTLETANVAEQRWIEKLGTRDPGKGFNLAKGGSHVPHPIRKNPWDIPSYRTAQISRFKSVFWKLRMNSPETKAKMSEASSGRKLINNPWDQRPFRERGIAYLIRRNQDPSIRRRISDKLTGRKLSQEHVENMRRSNPVKRLASLELARASLMSKPKKTHCVNGHSLDNALIGSKSCKDGTVRQTRKCRTCNRLRNTERRKDPDFRKRQYAYNSARKRISALDVMES